MQDPAAFIVALQHKSLKDAAVRCRLLCVSKAVRSHVLQQGLGQLSVRIYSENVDMVQSVGQWIKQHGQMLRSLTVDLHNKQAPMHAGFIAASLHEAAAAGLLRLQSVEWRCDDAIGLTLQLLSPHLLTELDMTLPRKLGADNVSSSNQQILTTLGQLTSLRKLSVRGSYEHERMLGDLDPMISAVTSLVKLTSLRLLSTSTLQDLCLLQQLPQQLQHLDVGLLKLVGSSPALQLNQLTALTCFIATGNGWGSGFTIDETDVLPAGLRELRVKDCLSCKPLLQLRRLQELLMCNSTTSASKLKQLSELTTLTNVSLTYGPGAAHGAEYRDKLYREQVGAEISDETHAWMAAVKRSMAVVQRSIAAAADGWSSVSGLRDLCFHDVGVAVPMSATTIKSMGDVSCLQSLYISERLLSEAALIELQSSLQRMTSLVKLEIYALLVGKGEGQDFWGRILRVDAVLAGILAGLPMLRRLFLHWLEVTGKADSVLSSATNLTHFELSCCDMVDEDEAPRWAGMAQLA